MTKQANLMTKQAVVVSFDESSFPVSLSVRQDPETGRYHPTWTFNVESGELTKKLILSLQPAFGSPVQAECFWRWLFEEHSVEELGKGFYSQAFPLALGAALHRLFENVDDVEVVQLKDGSHLYGWAVFSKSREIDFSAMLDLYSYAQRFRRLGTLPSPGKQIYWYAPENFSLEADRVVLSWHTVVEIQENIPFQAIAVLTYNFMGRPNVVMQLPDACMLVHKEDLPKVLEVRGILEGNATSMHLSEINWQLLNKRIWDRIVLDAADFVLVHSSQVQDVSRVAHQHGVGKVESHILGSGVRLVIAYGEPLGTLQSLMSSI